MWFYKGLKYGCFIPLKNDNLKDILPCVQYGCWCIQSNTSKLYSTNNFYVQLGTDDYLGLDVIVNLT